MTRRPIVTDDDIEIALQHIRPGDVVPEPASDARLHALLDDADEIGGYVPGVRITRMTIEVRTEDQANAVRRYLEARVRADRRVIGGYGGIEVEMVEARR